MKVKANHTADSHLNLAQVFVYKGCAENTKAFLSLTHIFMKSMQKKKKKKKRDYFRLYSAAIALFVNINSLFVYPKEWHALEGNHSAQKCNLG